MTDHQARRKAALAIDETSANVGERIGWTGMVRSETLAKLAVQGRDSDHIQGGS